MRKSSVVYSILFLLIILTLSCKTHYQPHSVNFVDYRLEAGTKKNNSLEALIQPYADSVNKSMNAVVVISETELEKKQPEGTLGNIMADALFAKAKQWYKIQVDAAFINYGGIRLPSVAKGSITRGRLFELAPFDNVIVLLKINGKTLMEFLNHISARGGWPVAGAQWQIKNKAAGNIIINGAPFNENADYTIAVTDYVANGGDDCSMLRPVQQINGGFLFRDALIEYLGDIHRQGKTIAPVIEKRVTNAE
jgi:2',3'-cyclic-nucleotide 2'-phosphodiesterase (5'-nucleotidase family)